MNPRLPASSQVFTRPRIPVRESDPEQRFRCSYLRNNYHCLCRIPARNMFASQRVLPLCAELMLCDAVARVVVIHLF